MDPDRPEAPRGAGDLLHPLGQRQAALGAALLALPFLSPVSLGPITTPVSLLIALLGLRLLRERDDLPVPARLLRVNVPRSVHAVMGRMLHRVSRWMDGGRAARPSPWVRGSRGRRLCGAGCW